MNILSRPRTESTMRSHLLDEHDVSNESVSNLDFDALSAKHDDLHSQGARHDHADSDSKSLDNRREAMASVIARAMPLRPTLQRSDSSDGFLGTMIGHFAVFNQWTEIDSLFEGHFLERVAPGAFKRSFDRFVEQRSSIRVTFNHGMDPQYGDKLLGVPTVLEEDNKGARYEVPLWDTSYNRDLLPGLSTPDGYGASFRFRVTKEEFERSPEPSDFNPGGLPERTIKEVETFEFGPVTYPAYDTASAGMRSLTDQLIFPRLLTDPDKLAELIATMRTNGTAAALDNAPERELTALSTSEVKPLVIARRFNSDDDWLSYIEQEIAQ